MTSQYKSCQRHFDLNIGIIKYSPVRIKFNIQGELNDKLGLVPCNFVEEIENIEDFEKQQQQKQQEKQEESSEVVKEEKVADKPTTSNIRPSARLISPIREDIKLRKSMKKSGRSGKNFLKTDSVCLIN